MSSNKADDGGHKLTKCLEALVQDTDITVQGLRPFLHVHKTVVQLRPVCVTLYKQECIPVGCVPSAAMAVSPAMHAPHHACPLPCMPHLPCTPPPCMPPFATHAPCHTCLFTLHAPIHHLCPLPCMPLHGTHHHKIQLFHVLTHFLCVDICEGI